ncbi:MAG: hypothetical protein HY720_24425 [Planctomycetes bacterium]|nr:hypothetical protein [Planctomycetota bacterium]
MRHARLLWLLFAVMAAGCASTAGWDFDVEKLGSLELGETSRDKVREALGDPATVGFVIRNQFEYELWTYEYHEGEERARRLRLGFGPDRKLAFHLFESSFERDSTDFDSSKTRGLVPGRTTLAEARNLLGDPPGRDLLAAGGELRERWIYSYEKRADGLPSVVKRAVLLFDSKGVLESFEVEGQGFTPR